MRPTADMVVAEIVVDSKLYAEGYDVTLRSRMRAGSKVKNAGRGEYIPLKSPPGQFVPPPPAGDTNTGDTNGESVLPLIYTIHTMPSSPLHSSGLNEGEGATRHLLRLSLPTAQYQRSTVRDPLTGETRSAPPIPTWLMELREGGAIVDVEVRPRKDGKGKKSGVIRVRVDGKDVSVVGEKESLTALGREELLDDKVSKMGVLSR